MAEDTSDLGSKLDELARMMVDSALEDGVSLELRTDVMKVAGNFYVARARVKSKLPNDPDEDTPNFTKFGASIRAVS